MSSSSPSKVYLKFGSFEEGGSAPPLKEAMAQKMISDFLAPSAAHVATRPQVELGDTEFELKSG